MPDLAFSILFILDRDHSIAVATCSWVSPVSRRAARSSFRRRRRSSSGLALSSTSVPLRLGRPDFTLRNRRCEQEFRLASTVLLRQRESLSDSCHFNASIMTLGSSY